MNLNKLEIIVLLAKHKKVTIVAEVLGVKQPTVSYHMKSLEEEYGVQLFEMRLGKVLFTEAGEALHHYAVKIHSLASEAGRVVNEFKNMERGSIRLGASYVPGIYLLSDLLIQFAKEHPHISINLEIKTAPVIHGMLLNHSIDIGIISSQERDIPGLYSEPVMDDELTLVLRPDHPFVNRTDLRPSDLAHEPFIFHDPQSSTRQMMLEWAQKHQINLHTRLELNSIEIIKRSVASGQGVTFMSKLAIQKELLSGELASIPIPDLQLRRFVYCCYHKERWLTSPIRLFLSLIKDRTYFRM